MDVEEAIKTRRSIRNYTTEEVSDEDINAILEAARHAPSGLNNQPWRFRVLRGEEKNTLTKHTKYGEIIKKAPVCIVVFLDKNASYSRTKDLQAIGACIQNILLTIHNRKLGGVWLGEIINQHTKVEQELKTTHELMAVIAVGHPTTEKNKTPGRKKITELLT